VRSDLSREREALFQGLRHEHLVADVLPRESRRLAVAAQAVEQRFVERVRCLDLRRVAELGEFDEMRTRDARAAFPSAG
jgi:hypothetical protein